MRGIKNIKQALQIIYRALLEKQIPWYAKVIFILIIAAYILSPVDLIPDMLPIIGVIDDILAIPLAIYLALLLIPQQTLDKFKSETAKESK